MAMISPHNHQCHPMSHTVSYSHSLCAKTSACQRNSTKPIHHRPQVVDNINSSSRMKRPSWTSWDVETLRSTWTWFKRIATCLLHSYSILFHFFHGLTLKHITQSYVRTQSELWLQTVLRHESNWTRPHACTNTPRGWWRACTNAVEENGWHRWSYFKSKASVSKYIYTYIYNVYIYIYKFIYIYIYIYIHIYIHIYPNHSVSNSMKHPISVDKYTTTHVASCCLYTPIIIGCNDTPHHLIVLYSHSLLCWLYSHHQKCWL